jgi:hypothetical protein
MSVHDQGSIDIMQLTRRARCLKAILIMGEGEDTGARNRVLGFSDKQILAGLAFPETLTKLTTDRHKLTLPYKGPQNTRAGTMLGSP